MKLFVCLLLFSAVASHAVAEVCGGLNDIKKFANGVCTVLEKKASHTVSGDPKFEEAFEAAYQAKLNESAAFEKDAIEKLKASETRRQQAGKSFGEMISKIPAEAGGSKAETADYLRVKTGNPYLKDEVGSLTQYAFDSLNLTQGQVKAIVSDPAKLKIFREYLFSEADLLRKKVDPQRSVDYQSKLKRNKEWSKARLADDCGGEGRQVAVNYGMNTNLNRGSYAQFDNRQSRGISGAADYLNVWGPGAPNMTFAQLAVNRGSIKAGSFKTEAEAYGLLLTLEKSDDYGLCSVFLEEESAKDLGYQGPQMVRGFFGSGKIFKDNSSDLNPAQENDLKAMVKQLPADQKLKVKIYTCASMQRNCAAGSESGGDCRLVDQLRYASDEDLLKKIEKEKIEAEKSGKSLNPESLQLEALLKNRSYQDALAGMRASRYYTDDASALKEQRLWLALSTLRGMEIEKSMRENHPGQNLEYVLVPTGDPADPYNNSKIDPALAGTCGPLGKPAEKEFYSGPDVSSCDMKKQLVEKVNRVYTDEVKEKLRSERKPEEGEYSRHRYANIEVETVPDSASKAGGARVKAYVVRCVQNADYCNHYKKEWPHLNLPKISLPSISFGGGGGRGGGGPFKDVCKAYPNRS